MNKLLLLLLFPSLMLAQDPTLIGDVDCSGEVNSEDASLILQFVTNVIDELPCQDNMTVLTPEQLQEIINMMDEQLSINYSGGGSSNYPAMISSISSETMILGDALVYCADLEEDGYSDWFLPNLDQLAYAVSGGCDLPDERNGELMWSVTMHNTYDSYLAVLKDSDSAAFAGSNSNDERHCRCVRFGEGETSEGSSGSSNSSGSDSSILGNSEQPITMVGPMFTIVDFPDFTSHYTEVYGDSDYLIYIDAIAFCGQLEYDGYNDWFLPTYLQIQHYIEQQGQSSIVFSNGFNSDNAEFWTKISSDWELYNNDVQVLVLNISGDDYLYQDLQNRLLSVYSTSIGSIGAGRNCFCVR